MGRSPLMRAATLLSVVPPDVPGDHRRGPRGRMRCSDWSGSDQLIETLDKKIELLRLESADSFPKTLPRQRSNLADLHPRSSWQVLSAQFQSQGEPRSLRLACESHCDHSPRSLVEDIVADHDDRQPTRLLMASDRFEVSPDDVASQYSGHSARSPESPSSASCCSKLLSSFAHSRASRLRSSRLSFSSTAAATAPLRLAYLRAATSSSSRASSSSSMVMATLAFPMTHLGMTFYHTPRGWWNSSVETGQKRRARRRRRCSWPRSVKRASSASAGSASAPSSSTTTKGSISRWAGTVDSFQ
jgi:hypothetical protein